MRSAISPESPALPFSEMDNAGRETPRPQPSRANRQARQFHPAQNLLNFVENHALQEDNGNRLGRKIMSNAGRVREQLQRQRKSFDPAVHSVRNPAG
jgi:hypothetical protein